MAANLKQMDMDELEAYASDLDEAECTAAAEAMKYGGGDDRHYEALAQMDRLSARRARVEREMGKRYAAMEADPETGPRASDVPGEEVA